MPFYSARNITPSDQLLFDANGVCVGIQPGGSSKTPLVPSSVSGAGIAVSGTPAATLTGITAYRQTNNTPPFIHKLSTSLYRIGWRLDDGAWGYSELKSNAAAGSTTLHYMMMLGKCIFGAATILDHDHASLVYTGTWGGSYTVAGTYGGTWKRATVAGDIVTIAVPQSRHIKISTVATDNMGYGLVTIDGDRTAANCLPTAQEEVTALRLASTALVANGGTLNPTDRVINYYKSGTAEADREYTLAVNLPDTTHTVVITCTGYKQSAATDFRVGISSYSYARKESAPDTGALFRIGKRDAWAHDNQLSAYEYAIGVEVTATNTLVGNYHGYENQTALTVYREGVAVTLADGAMVSGDVAIVRACDLSHPNQPALGASVTTYKPGQRGLTVRSAIAWAATADLTTGYFGMLPIPNHQITAQWVLEDGTTVSNGAGLDNSAVYYSGAAIAALADGVGVVHDTPLTTFDGDRWNSQPRGFFEDRAAMNKLYFFWRQNGATKDQVVAGRRTDVQMTYLVW